MTPTCFKLIFFEFIIKYQLILFAFIIKYLVILIWICHQIPHIYSIIFKRSKKFDPKNFLNCFSTSNLQSFVSREGGKNRSFLGQKERNSAFTAGSLAGCFVSILIIKLNLLLLYVFFFVCITPLIHEKDYDCDCKSNNLTCSKLHSDLVHDNMATTLSTSALSSYVINRRGSDLSIF